MLASALITLREGLEAHGIHELQEAALLPTIVEHVWNVNPILNEDGTLGQFLQALFGYNGNPSLIEVLSYVAYYVAVYLGTRASGQRRMPSAASA
jgi:high-affinity iron transporter